MPVILEYIPFQMERDMHLQQTESQKKCLHLNITLTSLYIIWTPCFPDIYNEKPGTRRMYKATVHMISIIYS